MLNGEQWFIWVAEENGLIVSHVYLELIHKVPRPGRVTHPFVYMTNVYTLKKYRSRGIGSKIMSAISEWVKEKENEFIIVWPSDESVEFYKRNRYEHCQEAMGFFP